MGTREMELGANMALQAAGIKDKRQQQAALDKYRNFLISQGQWQMGQAEKQQAALSGAAEAFIPPYEVPGSHQMENLVAGLLRAGEGGAAVQAMGLMGKQTPQQEMQTKMLFKMFEDALIRRREQDKPATTAMGWFLKNYPNANISQVQAFKQSLATPTNDKMRQLDIAAQAAGVDFTKLKKGELSQAEAQQIMNYLKQHNMSALQFFFGQILGGGSVPLGGPKQEGQQQQSKPELESIIK